MGNSVFPDVCGGVVEEEGVAVGRIGVSDNGNFVR
jgi:hypothetical protein